MAIKTDDFKKEKKFLIDFKINGAMMANLIKCSRGNYNEKLNNIRNCNFTDDQKKTIRKFIKKIAKAANNL